MALATYADLVQAVSDQMHRSDLAAYVPTWVALAESRIWRELRARQMIGNATLVTVAGTNAVALPQDWLETENITLLAGINRPLHVTTPEVMDEKWPANGSTGMPVDYTVVGNNIILGPSPDAAYSISIDYYQRPVSLTVTLVSWLLSNHPGIYLAGVMHEACIQTRDTDMLPVWAQRFQDELQSLQDIDDQSLRSGSSMRVRVL